jgi:hypothetical protein
MCKDCHECLTFQSYTFGHSWLSNLSLLLSLNVETKTVVLIG